MNESDEDEEFLTITELHFGARMRDGTRRRPVSIGKLATAVERHGCYGLDQYGRRGRNKAIAEDALKFLRFMADHRREEACAPPGQVVPLEMVCDIPDVPPFRWPLSELPDFDALGETAPASGAGGGVRQRQAPRNAAIREKYQELAKRGVRNYAKEIQRTVPGAEKLKARAIQDIAKGRRSKPVV